MKIKIVETRVKYIGSTGCKTNNSQDIKVATALHKKVKT